VEVLGNEDLILYQQVGKQTIEFGKPEEIEEKFSRINIYYKEILPQKGWNTYSRVNVKFKGQIVCE
jgi:cell division protein FtsQ